MRKDKLQDFLDWGGVRSSLVGFDVFAAIDGNKFKQIFTSCLEDVTEVGRGLDVRTTERTRSPAVRRDTGTEDKTTDGSVLDGVTLSLRRDGACCTWDQEAVRCTPCFL